MHPAFPHLFLLTLMEIGLRSLLLCTLPHLFRHCHGMFLNVAACMNIKKHLLCLKGYLSNSSGATCERAVVNLDPCLVFATGRSTSRPTQQPRRSWMGCWSQTLPRCTWCRLGWQVMAAPSPPPCCLFVTVCRWVLYLSVCLSLCQSAWAVLITDGFYIYIYLWI